MNTANRHLNHQLRQTEKLASLALERIRRAKTLVELVRAMTVSVRAEVRPFKHMCPSLKRLHTEAERRGRALVDLQLGILAKADGTLAFIETRGPMAAEWRALNGHLPVLATYVHQESSRLWSECFRRETEQVSTRPSMAADKEI